MGKAFQIPYFTLCLNSNFSNVGNLILKKIENIRQEKEKVIYQER